MAARPRELRAAGGGGGKDGKEEEKFQRLDCDESRKMRGKGDGGVEGKENGR